MNVLFIEDEELSRIGLMPILEGMGHTVDVAETVDEAVAKMQASVYDLVLLDVKLAENRQAGQELLSGIRSNRLGALCTARDVKVVAITAVADLGVNEALRSLGVSAILEKPIDSEEAIDALRTHLLTPDQPSSEASMS